MKYCLLFAGVMVWVMGIETLASTEAAHTKPPQGEAWQEQLNHLMEQSL